MGLISGGLVADVLERLHREAEAADAPLAQTIADQASSPEDIVGQFVEAERKDLKAVYHGLAGNFLNVSPQFGRFLYMCVRACKAKRIVEFGSSMGISAIYMAAALRDMGGGLLIGTELESSKAERARKNVADAGLADFVEFRVGDARETLKSGVGGDVDLLMLDGAFILYLPILELLEPHLKPGALIIGENAFEECLWLYRLRARPQERLSLTAAAVRSGTRQRIHGQDEVIGTGAIPRISARGAKR